MIKIFSICYNQDGNVIIDVTITGNVSPDDAVRVLLQAALQHTVEPDKIEPEKKEA